MKIKLSKIYLAFILMFILIVGFFIYDKLTPKFGYFIKDKSVFFYAERIKSGKLPPLEEKLEDVDYKDFEVFMKPITIYDKDTDVYLTQTIGKDKNSVFYNNIKLKGADPTTIRYIKPDFLEDKDAVYYLSASVVNKDMYMPSYGYVRFPEADVDTLKRLPNEPNVGYWIDKQAVYIMGNIIEGVDLDSFRVCSESDFTARDRNHFYREDKISLEPIPNCK